MADSAEDDLLKPNPLVEQVLASGAEGARVVRLAGYVGPPETKDHVRLYRTLSLNEYWDVPRSAVLHVEAGAGTRGCVALTVRSPAEVRHTRVGTTGSPRRDLLRGDLFTKALRASGGSMPRIGTGGLAFSTWICTIVIVSTLICFPDTIDPDPPDPEPPI